MWKFSVCVDNDCLHCKLNVVHQFPDGVSKSTIFIIFHSLNASENSVLIAGNPFLSEKGRQKGFNHECFCEKRPERPTPDASIVKLSSSASKIQKLIKSPLIATMIKMYTKSLSARYCRHGTVPLSPRKHLIGGKSVEFFRHAIVVYRKHGKCLKSRPVLCRFRQPRVPEALNPGKLHFLNASPGKSSTWRAREGLPSLHRRPGRL